MLIPCEAFGQADSPEVEIVWEKQFDSEIRIRPGGIPGTSTVEFLPEPCVGIDWSAPEGESPIRSVVTQESIYILDRDGKVTRQIPLDRKDLHPLQNKRDSLPFQTGGVSPDGRYYVIYDKVDDWEGEGIAKATVFAVDGTPVMAHSGLDAGEVMFSPNGKTIVVFRTSFMGDTRIAFYDDKFNLIGNLPLDFETYCFFSADGLYLLIRRNPGFMKFDMLGTEVGVITKEEFSGSRRIEMIGASHKQRLLYREKLRRDLASLYGKGVPSTRQQFIEETKAALKSKSHERIEEINRETHIRARQGIALSPSGRYGVFNTESAIVLFKVAK